MTMADDFLATAAEVGDALTNPKITVGHRIKFRGRFILHGNLPDDSPALSPVFMDDRGRLWIERHHDGVSELACVWDFPGIVNLKVA